MTDLEQLIFYIPSTLFNQLENDAKRCGVPTHTVVREALDLFTTNYDPDHPEQLRQWIPPKLEEPATHHLYLPKNLIAAATDFAGKVSIVLNQKVTGELIIQ